MTDTSALWVEVRATSKALERHLGECAEINKTTGRELKELRSTIHKGIVAIMSAQFLIIAFFAVRYMNSVHP